MGLLNTELNYTLPSPFVTQDMRPSSNLVRGTAGIFSIYLLIAVQIKQTVLSCLSGKTSEQILSPMSATHMNIF